ncbi:NAD(P)-dependent oxidoreductase [Kineosporia sp. J2-2]|uniref:NAD(P)-dependent oxidoreductase n=1 Tax=Kineosporia corallincola TaxID=2835133 RepID=A0ABS5TT64_9ACTN|nr:NAD(P)-dependent oxidoreductase [Kineosporia corallincola]MBT0773960.1 NAD(P)-dependent oxidoreductase [Kineosporia corallincola]
MAVVTVVGIGRMGLPICARLLSAGHAVTAVDVSTARLALAADLGARTGLSPEAAVERAEFVLTVLPGSPELEQLMSENLLDRLSGRIWVDLTSTDPALGRRLAEQAGQRGAAVLDAAMGGGVPAAESGTLTLFVGGERATLEAARPVLEPLAQRIRHLGDAGAGQVAKLLVNLLWFGQALAVGEALLLAQAEGLNLTAVSQVLAEGPAGSAFVSQYLPALFTGDYLTSFGLDRVVEELDSLRALAAGHGLPFDLSALVADQHARALREFGAVDGELMGIAYLEARAGRLLRPE